MKTYNLTSNDMVCAPGLIAWAINGAKFKRDRNQMIKIIAATWSLPRPAAKALVTGAVPHTVTDETVSFTA